MAHDELLTLSGYFRYLQFVCVNFEGSGFGHGVSFGPLDLEICGIACLMLNLLTYVIGIVLESAFALAVDSSLSKYCTFLEPS